MSDAWIEAKVVYDGTSKSYAADLVSNIFYDMGLQGVVLEDPEYEAIDGWADETVILPAHYAVIGYFPKDDGTAEKCSLLEERLNQLTQDMGIISHVTYRQTDSIEWVETWKAFFKPEKIGDQIIVKPTWCPYRRSSGETVIEIDPGMAFGTGTHPTTQLCISMIEKYLKTGDSFLDIGTGSGILLIAAAKLGVKKGLGIDIDKEAVKISRKNLLLNHFKPPAYSTRIGTGVKSIKDRYNIVAANILSAVILSLIDDLDQVLLPGGIFICSGFLEEQVLSIGEKIVERDYAVLEKRSLEGWAVITCKKQ